ncbi:hypothetical protein Tco_0275357 [Tanacetum coccineum]
MPSQLDPKQLATPGPVNPTSPIATGDEAKYALAEVENAQKEQSIPSTEQQIGSVQKEDQENKLPKTSTRKALFKTDKEINKTKSEKKIKHHR